MTSTSLSLEQLLSPSNWIEAMHNGSRSLTQWCKQHPWQPVNTLDLSPIATRINEIKDAQPHRRLPPSRMLGLNSSESGCPGGDVSGEEALHRYRDVHTYSKSRLARTDRREMCRQLLDLQIRRRDHADVEHEEDLGNAAPLQVRALAVPQQSKHKPPAAQRRAEIITGKGHGLQLLRRRRSRYWVSPREKRHCVSREVSPAPSSILDSSPQPSPQPDAVPMSSLESCLLSTVSISVLPTLHNLRNEHTYKRLSQLPALIPKGEKGFGAHIRRQHRSG